MGDQLNKIADEQTAGAFQSLFATFWPKVRAMLMRQGADREMAEEIARETMLAIGRRPHSYATDAGGISALIFAIARDFSIDRVKQQAVWQRYHEEFDTMERLQSTASGPCPCEQRRGKIETTLDGLPPEQLQVIQLSFVDGLSQSQIAAKLHLPLDTVKSRMRVAFDILRGAAERGS